jgi:hypothetical protein
LEAAHYGKCTILFKQKYFIGEAMMSSREPEPQRSLKKLTWQYENCLCCVWFSPNDPINADLMERGRCVHPKLKVYNLIVSGRDWCNLFAEMKQKQIDILQERAMKVEEKKGFTHSEAEAKERKR